MKQGWMAVLGVFLAAPASAQDELAAVNRPAPMFRLPVYNAKEAGGSVLGLERYVGADAQDKATKVVLMSFMASFCAPCKKEMPYLQSLHEKYKEHGLRVMMISIDTEADGQQQVADLIEKNKVTFPVLKDRFNLVARRYLGAQSPLPSVFMVKPDGVIKSVHRGYNQEASALLASEVQGSLGVKVVVEAPPPAPEKVEPAAPEKAPDEVAPAPEKTPAKSTGKKRGKRR